MSEQFYWCTTHHRVERAGETCPGRDLMGPYPSAEAARNWKQQHDQREDTWEAEDEAWEGDVGPRGSADRAADPRSEG